LKKIVLPYDESIKVFRPVTSMSKLDRHMDAYQRAMLVYMSAERAKEACWFETDTDLLFLRTEGPHSLFQLMIPVSGKGIEDGWKAVVEVPKLQEALLSLKKNKPSVVDLVINEASVRIGKIRIKTEDPALLSRYPGGISTAESAGRVPNPWNAIARAEHCVGDEGIPCVALLPGQILAAHLSQAILVDCDLLATDDKMMIPAKELKFVRFVGDTVHVRVSNEYLVLQGEGTMLAIRRMRWSRAMDEAIRLLRSASFVDEIAVDRSELVDALKTAMKILGKDADAELTFTPGGGNLRSVVEGDEVQYEFSVNIPSGKSYSLGLIMQMLQKAVEFAPEPEVVFKVPDLSGGPVNMIHLVDIESHEVIALGMTGLLQEYAG
jgi:hypothetical protein